MNQVAKAAWVEELRSGRWRQISGGFCDGEDGRCIAGVLCEAYIKVLGRGKFVFDEKLTKMNKRDTYRFDDQGAECGVKTWAGLKEQGSRSINYEGEHCDVATLSDIGVPFDILAGLIEMQL